MELDLISSCPIRFGEILGGTATVVMSNDNLPMLSDPFLSFFIYTMSNPNGLILALCHPQKMIMSRPHDTGIASVG